MLFNAPLTRPTPSPAFGRATLSGAFVPMKFPVMRSMIPAAM